MWWPEEQNKIDVEHGLDYETTILWRIPDVWHREVHMWKCQIKFWKIKFKIPFKAIKIFLIVANWHLLASVGLDVKLLSSSEEYLGVMTARVAW